MELQRSETRRDAGREHKEGLLQLVEGGAALQREVLELSMAPVLSAVPTWVHSAGRASPDKQHRRGLGEGGGWRAGTLLLSSGGSGGT